MIDFLWGAVLPVAVIIWVLTVGATGYVTVDLLRRMFSGRW